MYYAIMCGYFPESYLCFNKMPSLTNENKIKLIKDRLPINLFSDFSSLMYTKGDNKSFQWEFSLTGTFYVWQVQI